LSDISDLGAFTEIFINKEYEVNLSKDPGIIFDLGSNSGLSVIYFKLKYPNSKIFAFEPNPFAFEKLKKNTAQFSDVFYYNVAISDLDGSDKFYVCDVDSLSSSFVKRKTKGHYLEVKTRSIGSLIKELGLDRIDLMKFDVEGAEFKIFNNDFPFDLFDSMIGEVHLDLIDFNIDKQEFLSKFKQFYNVNIFDISNKRFVLKIEK
jgi:FkbM family methyltransferase